MIAPVAIVNLFTTLVIATRPTFWLKDVIGRHPNTDDNALTNPSQAIEPDVSFSVTSLPRPDTANADVSPMVSVAETRNIKVTERIAFALNSGLNGMICGSAMIEVSFNVEKSTIPMHTATM